MLRDQDVCNRLINAVIHGRIEIVKKLINIYGLSYSQAWSEGYALLCHSLKHNHVPVAKLLLTSGSRVNNENKKPSNTPLHFAVMNGDIEIVKMILNKGADIDAINQSGITPLHNAIKSNKVEVIKLLLKSKANVNARDNDGTSPLHIATTKGCTTVIKLFLQHGAEIDNQDKNGKTILHLAVQKGYLTIVEDVLKYCPDINNKSNKNSLKIAVYGFEQKYKKIVKALLQYGFTVNPTDANNPELLQTAIEKGYLKIVEDLLKYGADVNSRFKGFTPLHNALKNKQEKVAKLLINYKADINAQDKTGKTPIFYAIKSANLEIIKLLLTNRANIKDNPELLNIAVQKERIEIVEAVLQHGADINASDNYGRTALHFTVLSVNESFSRCWTNKNSAIRGLIAKLLLSKGANVDAKTKNGETTLHIAVKKECPKIVKVLLEYNANVNFTVKNNTPLHLSAEKFTEDISIMLLNKGANVNAKQKDGTTALHIATQKGNHEIVKVLLKYGAKVDSKTKNDSTPLHLAAEEESSEIIETLLKFGADINSRDQYGRTALHIASEKGLEENVYTLLEYGADINITSGNNRTPLDCVRDGINLWCNLVDDYNSDADCYFNPDCSINLFDVAAGTLRCHIVKMKIANLYVSEKNVRSLTTRDISDFQPDCEDEIASMKSEQINNTNISFYDILVKDTSLLTIYMRNENIVQVLKSGTYKKKFPMYASMIESNFRKSMERKELFEQDNKIFHSLFNNFPELPYDCTEKIFSYLSNKDLRILMDACKPLSINNPNINVNNVITPSIS